MAGHVFGWLSAESGSAIDAVFEYVWHAIGDESAKDKEFSLALPVVETRDVRDGTDVDVDVQGEEEETSSAASFPYSLFICWLPGMT